MLPLIHKLTRKAARPARASVTCGFETLEDRRMFAVAPLSGAILQSARTLDPGIYAPLQGFTSFSVTDASYDSTQQTAFQGGALRLNYSGLLQSGSAVTIEALSGGSPVATVKTYTASSVSNGLINLPAFAALTPGTYEFRATGTGTYGSVVSALSQPLSILPASTISGTFGGETLNYAGALGSGTVVFGLGGTDTLDFGGVTKAAVAGIDNTVLPFFHPTLSTSSQAIYRGSAFDHLSLSDGREVYFQGIEKLKFADGTVDLAIKPNDTYFADQWNLHTTDTAGAWRFTKGSSSKVLLASLDTGVLDADGGTTNIYDLSLGRLVTDPTDSDGYGGYGHGHASISILSSTANNASKVAGINWYSKVYVNDVYNGVSLQTAISDTINYAKANGYKVVFQGGIQGEGWLTSGGTQAQLETLISDNKDIAFFAVAAGNGGPGGNLNDPNYLTSVSGVAKLQSGHDNVASVGALAKTSTVSVDGLDNAASVGIAGYSNRGSNLTLVGPTNVPAADKLGGVRTFGGTSAANPNVAGFASLVWSVNPNLSGGEVRNLLTTTAMDLGTPGRDNTYGAGLVNTEAAVRRAWSLNKDSALAKINEFKIKFPLDIYYTELQVAEVIGPDPVSLTEFPIFPYPLAAQSLLPSAPGAEPAGAAAEPAGAAAEPAGATEVATRGPKREMTLSAGPHVTEARWHGWGGGTSLFADNAISFGDSGEQDVKEVLA